MSPSPTHAALEPTWPADLLMLVKQRACFLCVHVRAGRINFTQLYPSPHSPPHIIARSEMLLQHRKSPAVCPTPPLSLLTLDELAFSMQAARAEGTAGPAAKRQRRASTHAAAGGEKESFVSERTGLRQVCPERVQDTQSGSKQGSGPSSSGEAARSDEPRSERYQPGPAANAAAAATTREHATRRGGRSRSTPASGVPPNDQFKRPVPPPAQEQLQRQHQQPQQQQQQQQQHAHSERCHLEQLHINGYEEQPHWQLQLQLQQYLQHQLHQQQAQQQQQQQQQQSMMRNLLQPPPRLLLDGTSQMPVSGRQPFNGTGGSMGGQGSAAPMFNMQQYAAADPASGGWPTGYALTPMGLMPFGALGGGTAQQHPAASAYQQQAAAYFALLSVAMGGSAGGAGGGGGSSATGYGMLNPAASGTLGNGGAAAAAAAAHSAMVTGRALVAPGGGGGNGGGALRALAGQPRAAPAAGKLAAASSEVLMDGEGQAACGGGPAAVGELPPLSSLPPSVPIHSINGRFRGTLWMKEYLAGARVRRDAHHAARCGGARGQGLAQVVEANAADDDARQGGVAAKVPYAAWPRAAAWRDGANAHAQA
eukprot:11563-Chlamydomonas_euryale.AAC.1